MEARKVDLPHFRSDGEAGPAHIGFAGIPYLASRDFIFNLFAANSNVGWIVPYADSGGVTSVIHDYGKELFLVYLNGSVPERQNAREHVGPILVPSKIKGLLGEVIGLPSFAGVQEKSYESKQFNHKSWLPEISLSIVYKVVKIGFCFLLGAAFLAAGLVHIQDLAPARNSIGLFFVGIACLLVGAWFIASAHALVTDGFYVSTK